MAILTQFRHGSSKKSIEVNRHELARRGLNVAELAKNDAFGESDDSDDSEEIDMNWLG